MTPRERYEIARTQALTMGPDMEELVDRLDKIWAITEVKEEV